MNSDASGHSAVSAVSAASSASTPLSYTEDFMFISRDDDVAMSCVYYERAVAVAQFALTKAPAYIVCSRADKFVRETPVMVIDLAGMDNPYRDERTKNIRHYIGSGVELQVRQRSLYVIRHSRNAIVVKNWSDQSRFSLPEGNHKPAVPSAANMAANASKGESKEGSPAVGVNEKGELPYRTEVCLFDFQVGSLRSHHRPRFYFDTID